MDGIQFNAAMNGLMGKLTTIAGWRIPDGHGAENYEKVFTDQLNKFIFEQFGNITLSELEYAVRKYGVNLSDWGRPMHLGLLSHCLTEYLAYRATVSELEERSSIDQKQAKIESLGPVSVDWSNDWGKIVYAAKIGQIKNIWIPIDLYDYLIRIGLITVPDKNDPEAVAADKADKWEILKGCAAQYLVDIKDALLSGLGIEPPFEIKRRIALLENTESPIWKKDTVIMSTLTIMAKKEIIRQLALSEASNETE